MKDLPSPSQKTLVGLLSEAPLGDKLRDVSLCEIEKLASLSRGRGGNFSEEMSPMRQPKTLHCHLLHYVLLLCKWTWS